MKTLSKKNLLVVLLSFVFALSMVAFASTVKPVKAEGEAVITITKADFQIQEEASVRIGTVGDSGIRFRASISDNLMTVLENALEANPEEPSVYMGFIITPKYYFNKAIEGKEDLDAIDYLNTETGVEKYVGENGVGILIKTIYKENGKYYALAALNNIKANNVNVDFTAIAYVFDGNEVIYSIPNTDFSRTYSKVVEKAYIEGHELISTAKWAVPMVDDKGVEQEGIVTNFETGKTKVCIETSKDLYNLSYAVADGKTFENAKFEIVNNLEVDYDFEPIDNIADDDPLLPYFKGTITAKENTEVKVYNKGLNDYSEKPFSILLDGEVENLTYVATQEIFDMTDKAGKLLTYSYGENNKKFDFYGETIAYRDRDDVANYIKYNQDAVGIDVTVNGATVQLKVNYTAEELDAYRNAYEIKETGKELAVKFTYMAEGTLVQNNYGHNLLQAGGHGNAESGMVDIPEYRWMTAYAKIEDVIAAYSGEMLNIYQPYSDKVGDGYNFYIGGLEFAEWDFTNGIVMNYDHKFSISEEGLSRMKSNNTNNKYSIVTAENLPATTRYGSSVTQVTNNIDFNSSAILGDCKTTSDTSIMMPYTGEQYKMLSEREGTSFNAVKFTYMFGHHGSNKSTQYAGSLMHSSGNKSTSIWTTAILTVDQFVAAFGAPGNSTERGHFADPTSRRLVIRADGYAHNGYTICIGGLEFLTLPEGAAYFNFTEIPKFNLEATEENKSKLSRNNSTYSTPGFVESVPAEKTYTETIDNGDGTTTENSTKIKVSNPINYQGPALVFANTRPHLPQLYISFNVAGNKYLTYSALGYFNAVKFSYLIETDPGLTSITAGTDKSIMGEAHYGYKSVSFDLNRWTTVVLPIEKFVVAFDDATATRARLAYSYSYSFRNSALRYNWYLSDFVFDNYDLDSVTNKGTLDFKASEESMAQATYNFNNTFVPKDQLPTEGISNTYNGDAIRYTFTHNETLNLKFNYTKAEYAKLYEQGEFDTVKFSYLIVPHVDISSIDNNTAKNIIGLAGYGKKEKSLAQNEWVTCELTAEDFISAFSTDAKCEVQFFLTYTSVGSTKMFDFYLGDISFVK